MRNARERVTLSFLSGIRKGLFAVFVESRKKVLPPRHDSSHFHHEWELMERELKQATNPTEQCSEEARNLSRNLTSRQRIDGSDQICSSVCLRERKREKRRGIRKEEEVPPSSCTHVLLTNYLWRGNRQLISSVLCSHGMKCVPQLLEDCVTYWQAWEFSSKVCDFQCMQNCAYTESHLPSLRNSQACLLVLLWSAQNMGFLTWKREQCVSGHGSFAGSTTFTVIASYKQSI